MPAIDPKDLIAGLGKGLRLIEAFDDEHPRLSVSEAAERTGLSRAAARRFLLSLVHFGYAGSDGRQFWLEPRVLRLGQSYLEAARLPRLVQPFIQRVSMQCGETVNFSVLDGHELVYMARSNPPRLVSIGYNVGARVPAHVVTPGIAILATLSDEALERWIAEHDFSSFTAYTVTQRKRFRDHVLAARAQGWWSTEQQLNLGLRGLALALKNRKGLCQGALGILFQMQSHTTEQMQQRLLPPLQEAAEALRPLL